MIYYDSKTDRFLKRTVYGFADPEDEEIGDFQDLNEYRKGEFKGVRFNDYDFKGINIADYDLSKAIIPASTLKKLGMYDDSFRQELKSVLIADDYGNPSDEGALECVYENLPTSDFKMERLPPTEARVFYISDMHLDHKIRERFPGEVSENEVASFLEDIIRNMYVMYRKYHNYGGVLFAGDISHSFKIVKMFYSIFSDIFNYMTPAIILGNHEMWDFPSKRTLGETDDALDTCISEYEKMFDELCLSFIHNMLYSMSSREFVRFEELMKASDKEIRDFCNSRKMLVLGGTGFAGLNTTMNCDVGLYRDTLKSREREIEESKKFDDLYGRLLKVIPDIPLIVLTHMPMDCWTEREPNPNWIYVSGHTHRNGLTVSDALTEYHDNQIGYHSKTMLLKSFLTIRSYDYFRDYTDGIHCITVDGYERFNRGLSISMDFHRKGEIFMLKRDGLYCFILKNEKGKLLILDGGKVKKLAKDDLQYYYDRIPEYSKAVIDFTCRYEKKLREISERVKAFGGDGTIHGLIVDISFMSHLFLNPNDGSVIPYYAYNMVDKVVYKDVKTLLEECERPLLKEYQKCTKNDGKALEVLGTNTSFKGKKTTYNDTWIYRCSLLFRKFQYLTECHVIRNWREELLDNPKNSNEIAMEIMGIRSLMEAER